jgi:hypothetical protein
MKGGKGVLHTPADNRKLLSDLFLMGAQKKLSGAGPPGATSRHTASVISTDFFLRFQYFQGVFSFFDRFAVRPSFRSPSIRIESAQHPV